MPRFSVIVPAYKVQAYLHECLESVLGQSYTDLELIAVDDCSPDACGDIVDEFAARDERVRPLHLPENVGLGHARNAGLAQATGDHLLFLDGDDTLAPGALRAIADRLDETGDPDVLVFDYARAHWNGGLARNRLAALLTEDGPAPFRLDERPELLRLLMVVWNKAYKREFTERAGLSFPPGYYEDTPWTYPALLAAGSIATLDQVCVHYRQRRQGNILATTSRSHFDVFAQYDRVFAYVAAHPELAHWRPVLFRRMADHLLTVLSRPGRLPRGARGEFLRRARGHCLRYGGGVAVAGGGAGLPEIGAAIPEAGTALPEAGTVLTGAGAAIPTPLPAAGPRTRVRHALLRHGNFPAYAVLRAAAVLARRATRALRAVHKALRTTALLLHHRFQRLLPLRPDQALFVSRDHGTGGDPGALAAALHALAPHIRTVWVAPPGQDVPAHAVRVTPGSAGHRSALARSAYLIADTAWDGWPSARRREQVVLHADGATPLKRVGLDLCDRPAATRPTDLSALPRAVDTWDYSLSGNRHTTLVHERVLPGSYTTLEYGRPRNDRYLTATSDDVARARESLGIPDGRVALLYAPTHRDYRRSPVRLLDLERVARRLGPGFVLLARAHPRYGAPLVHRAAGDVRDRLIDVSDVSDVSAHPSVETLCLAADALITDYSSLMVDYANLDRPIVLHLPDPEAYEAARGTCFDLRGTPPGPVTADEDELVRVFTDGRWRDEEGRRLRAEFRERFCPYDDGRAAERVVRRVVLGETSGLPAVVPLGQRRPAAGAAPCPAPVPTAGAAPGRAPVPAAGVASGTTRVPAAGVAPGTAPVLAAGAAPGTAPTPAAGVASSAAPGTAPAPTAGPVLGPAPAANVASGTARVPTTGTAASTTPVPGADAPTGPASTAGVASGSAPVPAAGVASNTAPGTAQAPTAGPVPGPAPTPAAGMAPGTAPVPAPGTAPVPAPTPTTGPVPGPASVPAAAVERGLASAPASGAASGAAPTASVPAPKSRGRSVRAPAPEGSGVGQPVTAPKGSGAGQPVTAPEGSGLGQPVAAPSGSGRGESVPAAEGR